MAREHQSKYILTAEDRTRQAFASLERSFKSTERAFSTLRNLTAGAFSVAGLVAFANKNAEAERAANRLTAVINAQGHAAGFTRKQLDDMADSLAASTQFDDEDFRNGEATLLKFGNVYNDVFTRALKLSADLAAFQGEELSSGIEAVGKALQNPAEGIKQLQAAIGKLDPAQRKLLENLTAQNRITEAQNLLLDILQKKLGGTAQLMNSGFSKALSDTAKNFEELVEAIGRTSVVQGAVGSFFGFLNTSLKDMKTIIESGSWFEGLLFLLGGRGATDKRSFDAKAITDLQDTIAKLESGAGGSRGVDRSKGRLDELKKRLAELQAQYDKLYATAGKPIPSPKPSIDSGPQPDAKFGDTGRDIWQEKMKEHLKIIEEIRKAQHEMVMETATFGQNLFDQELDARAQILPDTIREESEARQASAKNMVAYLKALEDEREMMGMTNAQRARYIDTLFLEQEQVHMTAGELAGMTQRLIAAREAQEKLNGSWAFGASVALDNYLEMVHDVAFASEALVVNAFKGMEDALIKFVQTGKLNFTDLAQSIVADLIRIQVQQSITGPLAGVLQNINWGGNSSSAGSTSPTFNDSHYISGRRASGGPVSANLAYMVGEQGPELFVPTNNGNIVPNGGGGSNVNISIDARGATRDMVPAIMAELNEFKRTFNQRAVSAVKGDRQRSSAGYR